MHLNISPSSARLGDVRRAARRVLHAVPEDIAHDFLLVIDEGVANAVRHGSAGGGPIEVFLDVSADGWIDLRVVDRGPTAALPVLPAEPPPLLGTGGRGLWLMCQLADEVQFERAGSGTRLWVRRRIAAADHAGLGDPVPVG